MRSVNRVTLMGYVGQDPQIAATNGGKTVANVSLATSYKTGDKEYTEWHRLVAFERTAEVIRDYVTKGSPLYVEGSIRTRTWEKDGETRYSTEVVIREMSLLPRAEARGRAGDPVEAATAAAERARDTRRANVAPDGTEITDDDIPF